MVNQKVIHKQLTEAPQVREDGSMVFRCSDASVDRVGDRVLPQGIRLERYQANPVLQWSHDHDIPAIGTGKVWVENDALWMSPTFSTANPLGAQIKAQVEAGEIRAVSIGFIPLEGKPNEHGGYDFTATELTEISFVNVPCHPGALREKSMSDDQFKALVEQLAQLSAKVDAVAAAVTAAEESEAEAPAEEPTEKDAPQDDTQEEPGVAADEEDAEKAFFALFAN